MSPESSHARRLRRPLLLLGLVACLAGGVAWLLWPTDPIGPRAFDRIQVGMTATEVEAVIGVPPGNYRSGASIDLLLFMPFRVGGKGGIIVDGGSTNDWYGDEFSIMVAYDETEMVTGVSLWETRPRTQPSLLDRLRTRLGI